MKHLALWILLALAIMGCRPKTITSQYFVEVAQTAVAATATAVARPFPFASSPSPGPTRTMPIATPTIALPLPNSESFGAADKMLGDWFTANQTPEDMTGLAVLLMESGAARNNAEVIAENMEAAQAIHKALWRDAQVTVRAETRAELYADLQECAQDFVSTGRQLRATLAAPTQAEAREHLTKARFSHIQARLCFTLWMRSWESAKVRH